LLQWWWLNVREGAAHVHTDTPRCSASNVDSSQVNNDARTGATTGFVQGLFLSLVGTALDPVGGEFAGPIIEAGQHAGAGATVSGTTSAVSQACSGGHG
jgi:hypothetical protein